MTQYQAFIDKMWRETGMTSLFVARIRDGGARVEVGSFLVDQWCLGIKDAFYLDDLSMDEWNELVEERLPERFRETFHPACAKRLVEGALAYAEGLGFAPARDFRKARRVLGGIDASACPIDFKFGHDGKPCYVQGPDDTPERVDRVLAVLSGRFGEGEYGYILQEDEEETTEAVAAEDAAREWLLDFFSNESAGKDNPGFWGFSGLVAAMHVCPNLIMPTKLMEKLWGPEGRVWESEGEMMEFTSNLMAYWNFIGGIFAQRMEESAKNESPEIEGMELDPVDVFADDLANLEEMANALFLWARGFLRATEIWPEAWGDALERPELAPHWKTLRAMADPKTRENDELLAELIALDPAGGVRLPLSTAVSILHRALRSPP